MFIAAKKTLRAGLATKSRAERGIWLAGPGGGDDLHRVQCIWGDHIDDVDVGILGEAPHRVVIVNRLFGKTVIARPPRALGGIARDDARQPAKLRHSQRRPELSVAVIAESHQCDAQLAALTGGEQARNIRGAQRRDVAPGKQNSATEGEFLEKTTTANRPTRRGRGFHANLTVARHSTDASPFIFSLSYSPLSLSPPEPIGVPVTLLSLACLLTTRRYGRRSRWRLLLRSVRHIFFDLDPNTPFVVTKSMRVVVDPKK